MSSNDGSGSGSGSGSSSLKAKTKTGGGSTSSDSLVADLGSIASAMSSRDTSQSKRLKPMDEVDMMAYLKDAISANNANLKKLLTKLDFAAKDRDRLLDKDNLVSSDEIKSLSAEDGIYEMRIERAKLVGIIDTLKATLGALKNAKNLVVASVPVHGT